MMQLHNPKNVIAIFVCNSRDSHIVEADEGQGFQEYPGSWELWTKNDKGHPVRIKRWLKKSVIGTFTTEDKFDQDRPIQ